MSRRALFGTAAATLAALVSLAVPSGTASAHADLENSIPAAGSVLEEAPSAITLDFDEPVEAAVASIELFDANEDAIALGEPAAAGGDGTVVIAAVPPIEDGLYAVVWRVTSIDGHVIDGAFSFQVGSAGGGGGDGSALVDAVSAGSAADTAVARLADLARLAGFVGIVLLLGAGLFALMAPASLTTAPATRVVVVGGWLLLLVGSVASFGLLGASAVGGTVADAVSPEVWASAADTRTGRMVLVRLALTVAMGGLLVLVGSSATAWWRSVTMGVVVGLVLTFPAGGHPAASSPRALWVLLDAVHLAAVAIWLGGLALFTLGGRAWLRDDEAAPVVRSFSRSATWLVPVIVVTGTLQAIDLAGGLDAIGSLTDTGWGRALLVKVSVVSVLVALGGVSRWLLHASGVGSLRRTVVAEAVIGLVVLGVTANLVSMSPEPVTETRLFNATITEAGVLADITITPGRVGSNEIHLVITPAGNSLQPVVGASARMTLPSRDIPETPVVLVADGRNHFTGSVTLPFAGDWELELLVEVSPGATVLLDATVPIP